MVLWVLCEQWEHYGGHMEYIMNIYMARWSFAGSSKNGENIELYVLLGICFVNVTDIIVYQLLYRCMIPSYYTHKIKGNVI